MQPVQQRPIDRSLFAYDIPGAQPTYLKRDKQFQAFIHGSQNPYPQLIQQNGQVSPPKRFKQDADYQFAFPDGHNEIYERKWQKKQFKVDQGEIARYNLIRNPYNEDKGLYVDAQYPRNTSNIDIEGSAPGTYTSKVVKNKILHDQIIKNRELQRSQVNKDQVDSLDTFTKNYDHRLNKQNQLNTQTDQQPQYTNTQSPQKQQLNQQSSYRQLQQSKSQIENILLNKNNDQQQTKPDIYKNNAQLQIKRDDQQNSINQKIQATQRSQVTQIDRIKENLNKKINPITNMYFQQQQPALNYQKSDISIHQRVNSEQPRSAQPESLNKQSNANQILQQSQDKRLHSLTIDQKNYDNAIITNNSIASPAQHLYTVANVESNPKQSQIAQERQQVKDRMEKLYQEMKKQEQQQNQKVAYSEHSLNQSINNNPNALDNKNNLAQNEKKAYYTGVRPRMNPSYFSFLSKEVMLPEL